MTATETPPQQVEPAEDAFTRGLAFLATPDNAHQPSGRQLTPHGDRKTPMTATETPPTQTEPTEHAGTQGLALPAAHKPPGRRPTPHTVATGGHP